MCEILVGLPDVNVLGIDDEPGEALVILIECRAPRPCCPVCGGAVAVKDRPVIELVDLPAFGRPTCLSWRKHRWVYPSASCPAGSFTGEDERIAAPRMTMTSRAGRWITEQIGRYARSVNEIANELSCDWHTVNDALIAYGTALVDDPERFGDVEALGMDEVLFCRLAPFHRQHFSTQLVDVRAGQLLDVVPGRSGAKPTEWLLAQGQQWRDKVRFATLDLSGPYRAVLDVVLPDATQVADPFPCREGAP